MYLKVETPSQKKKSEMSTLPTVLTIRLEYFIKLCTHVQRYLSQFLSSLPTDVSDLPIDVHDLSEDVSELYIGVLDLPVDGSELHIDVYDLLDDVSDFPASIYDISKMLMMLQ